MRIGIFLALLLVLSGCEAGSEEMDPASGILKATEKQRIQILEMRADASGPQGVFYSRGGADSAVFSAGGVPMEFGIKGLSPEREGYKVTLWVGNLSSVVIGKCQATFALRAGSAADAKEVTIPGTFSPGKVVEFSFVIPSRLKQADGLALSAPRCFSTYYLDQAKE